MSWKNARGTQNVEKILAQVCFKVGQYPLFSWIFCSFRKPGCSGWRCRILSCRRARIELTIDMTAQPVELCCSFFYWFGYCLKLYMPSTYYKYWADKNGLVSSQLACTSRKHKNLSVWPKYEGQSTSYIVEINPV